MLQTDIKLLVILCGVLITGCISQRCFDITYVAVTSSPEGFLSHAGYPDVDYPPDGHWCWLLTAPEGEVIHLDAFVELEPGCSEALGDRLMVYDGEDWNASLLDTMCGSETQEGIQTSGNSAYIEFITDSTTENRGFKINHWSESAPSVSRCDDITLLYSSSNPETFYSHDLYGVTNYPPNEYSCWLIEAPAGQHVFLDVDVDMEGPCDQGYGDRVIVYGGDGWHSHVEHVMCGIDRIEGYEINDRFAYIEFHTDGFVEAPGFKISYWHEDSSVEEDEDDSDVGVIIGIVIGCLIGLAIIIAIIVVCCVVCNSSKKKVQSTSQSGGYNQGSRQAYPTQQYSSSKQYSSQQYSNQQYGAPAAGGMVAGAAAPQPPPPYPGQAKPALPPIGAHPVDQAGVPMPAVYVEP